MEMLAEGKGMPNDLLWSLFIVYYLWSVFWGLVWFWPKWRRFVASFREKLGGWFIIAKPFTWLIIFIFYISFYLVVPWQVAVFYGIFGGGIYQYRKHRKLAMRSD